MVKTLPLKVNKETPTERKDIILEVVEKNWIGILGDNALRILVMFYKQQSEGEALLGDYDYISNSTNKSRGSVSSGLSELELLGFIIVKKVINKKTKLYEINTNICRLSEKWVNFFKVAKYKKFCLDALQGKSIDNSVVDELQLYVVNSKDDDVETTLGRLLYLYVERKGFNIEDLLEEERTKMAEDLFPNGFGFGDDSEKVESWQDVLTDEEKRDKFLIDILTHYVALVDYPTRRDVDMIKHARLLCYPYQIKNGITSVKNHPRYGDKFKSFAYINEQVVSGRFGTRKNSNAKGEFSNKKQANKVNNQTDLGFKTSGLSRTEVIDVLNKCAVDASELKRDNVSNGNIEEEAFDFSLLNR